MTSLERFLKEQDKIINDDKEKTLMALGITKKEYAPDGKNSYRYSKCEHIDGEKRYYREVAADVSDEEYAVIIEKMQKVAEIKKKKEKYLLSKAEQDAGNNTTSKIATILRYIVAITAVIVVICVLVLLTMGDSLRAAIITLGCTFVESLLLLALAEILDRLAEISYYTKRINRATTEQ